MVPPHCGQIEYALSSHSRLTHASNVCTAEGCGMILIVICVTFQWERMIEFFTTADRKHWSASLSVFLAFVSYSNLGTVPGHHSNGLRLMV